MPPATPETRQQVLKAIMTALPTPFAKRPPRPTRSESPLEPQSATKYCCKKPPRLLCGINEVTRALERGKVQLAVVCRDVTPALLVAHIPVLCFTTGTPVIVMPGDGTDLGYAFGTRRLLAFAIRKCQEGEKDFPGSVPGKLVQGLQDLASPLDFPWLAAAKREAPVPEFPKPVMVQHRNKMDIG